MKEITRKGWMLVVCILLLLAAFLWQPLEIYSLATGNLRQLTRSLVWTGFRNSGTQGGVLGRTDSRSTFRMTYPGMATGIMLNMAGPDFVEYWGIKPGYDWQTQKEEAQNTSGGEGAWVLTKVGDKYGVSYSGPFNPTSDTVPMYYDIANGPEKNQGYRATAPARARGAGAVISNWYPGAIPQTGDPESGVPYEIVNFRYGKYMDPDKDSAAEETILSQWTTKNGVTVTRKAMAWSYQGFDDFFILEFTFKNTGDSNGDGKPDVNGGAGYTLNDTYFAFMNQFTISQGAYVNQGMPGDRGGTRVNDDVYRYTDSPSYDGPVSYKGLKLSYQWDGDSPEDFSEDTGEPVKEGASQIIAQPGGRKVGQLMAYQYVGMAPLAYQDKGIGKVFNSKDQGRYVNPAGEQPVSSRWWEMKSIQSVTTDAPNIGSSTEKGMYEELTSPTKSNPNAVGAFINAQTFGPYNLAVGDQAKIVMVYVAGSGANAIPRADLPEYSVDMETFAVQGIPLLAKDLLARLAKGEQALVDNLKAAQFAYDSGYDLPDYPPDVDFTIRANENAQNELSWTDAAESSANPDYAGAEAQDIAGYRVYRSAWQEFGPWVLMATIPKATSGATWTYGGGAYKWNDIQAISGFNYFYNVRAYARPHATWTNGVSAMKDLPAEVLRHFKAGLEGGYSSPMQRDNAASSPFMPKTVEGDQLQKQIKVVPNPFSLGKEGYNYQSSRKIRFVGIPTKCKITIYNFAGEIVGEVLHNNPNSGEDEWLQKERNLAALEVATGVYFYVVESQVPESLGKKAKGTFYVIR